MQECLIFLLIFLHYILALTPRSTNSKLSGSHSESSKTRLYEYDPWSPLKQLFGGQGVGATPNKSSYTGNAGSRYRVKDTEAVVVGSGITGSTAAYYLDKAGVDVVLTEAKDEVGGSIISKSMDGFLWEEGPHSFQPTLTILRLVKDLDLMDELVLSNSSLPRYVYWDENLYALPGGLSEIPKFKLLSLRGKIRAALGALGFIAPKPEEEESVKSFVTRHLGTEAFERVVDPFISGIYAGDPDTLSMKAALKKVYKLEDLGPSKGILDGAIMRINQLRSERELNGDRDLDLPIVPGGSLGSFREGLQSLPLRIKEVLGSKQVETDHELIDLKRDGSDWLSTFAVDGGTKRIVYRSKSVILTTPAYATAKILADPLSESCILPQAKVLEDISYPPIASVSIAYPNEAFRIGPPEGYGHLIPRKQEMRTLGTIWTSSLFPGRCPEGYTMLLSYIGGAQDPSISDLTDDEIVAAVHADIQKVLLVPDAPLPRVMGVKLWPQSIPQYNKGHTELLEKLESDIQTQPGLYLGGSYKTGVSIGECIQYGADVATEVTTFLSVCDVAANVMGLETARPFRGNPANTGISD